MPLKFSTYKKGQKFLCTLIILSVFISCESKKKHDNTEKEKAETIKHSINDTASTIKFYLTFDDGPYQTTPELISRLKELNVKSSFFIVGSQVKYSLEYDSIFNAVKNTPIFKIYNHTYSHAVTKGRIHQYYKDPEKVFNDIHENKAIINTGGNITRLPGKNSWRLGKLKTRSDDKTKILMDYLDSNKINENIVGWDVEWSQKHSRSRNDVDSLLKQIKTLYTKDTSSVKHVVLLSHDYLYRNKESLENLSYLVNRLQSDLKCTFHWVEELDGLFPESK